MSFRLIPSPSSSFPFPHLGQKRHKDTERTARSLSCPAWQAAERDHRSLAAPGPAPGPAPAPLRACRIGSSHRRKWPGDPGEAVLDPPRATQAFAEVTGLMQRQCCDQPEGGAESTLDPSRQTPRSLLRKAQTCHHSAQASHLAHYTTEKMKGERPGNCLPAGLPSSLA